MDEEIDRLVNYDLIDLKQFENIYRAKRVKREFLIDRVQTGFGDTEYERIISASPSVVRNSRRLRGYGAPSRRAIQTFSENNHKRYPAPETTRAVEQYLIDKHNLPRTFFAIDQSDLELALRSQDNIKANILGTETLHWENKFKFSFLDDLTGVFVFSGAGLPHNFNLCLLVDLVEDKENKRGAFLVRGVAECDQEARVAIFNRENSIIPKNFRPSRYETIHLRGYAYIERQNFVFVLKKLINGYEHRISVPLMELVLLRGINYSRFNGQETVFGTVNLGRSAWSVAYAETSRGPIFEMHFLKPETSEAQNLQSAHEIFLAKVNPSIPISEEGTELCIAPLFNIFLRNIDTDVFSSNEDFGIAPYTMNNGRPEIDIDYANRCTSYLKKYYDYSGHYSNELVNFIKSLYTV